MRDSEKSGCVILIMFGILVWAILHSGSSNPPSAVPPPPPRSSTP